MTIAACYLSAEGVVLGADSTSTMFVAGRGGQMGTQHQYNFAQKVFEFGGPGSTAGMALWGLGSLGSTSHRTLIAEMADEATKRGSTSLEEVAQIAGSMFWKRFETTFEREIKRARELHAKDQNRTPEENAEYWWWEQSLSGGFCLGGRWGTNHQPKAFEIMFGPFQVDAPKPKSLPVGGAYFWGCPNLIDRLIFGMDVPLLNGILTSDKWTGTREELWALINQGALGQPFDLPLREAIDWVYASIYTTIKAMKFSHLAPVCGGPIEIAVVSSDRPFRWVRHKRLGEAIDSDQTKEAYL